MSIFTASSSATVIPLCADQTATTKRDPREAARRFLRMLDPGSQDFTFQTFDEKRK